MLDKKIDSFIKKEKERQNRTVNLIASENYVSKDVLRALGSVFTNKYAEGYSKMRYYGGNGVIDELETLTKERALKLFRLKANAWSVNVQPYSGSPANLAVYHALVPIGEKIMGMSLPMGGHLTHGHRVSVTGKLWEQIPYSVDKNTELLDYKQILRIAKKEKPKLIIAGFTAYSRIVDFKEFRRIANSCGAILMVDMSHFAGLVAGRVYPPPFFYADVVTTTTHKTLRGPRSAMIFSRKDKFHDSRDRGNREIKISELIDRTVFPGLQGGPHANQIAAVAIALYEASRPTFKKYANQIVKNTQMLARELQKLGWRIVSGGTDTHLFLIDTWAKGISGKVASDLLESVGIIVNKNTIPYDSRNPVDPSGIRIGTPAVTTRGFKEKEMTRIAELISQILLKKISSSEAKKKVLKLTSKFPLRLYTNT